MGKVFREGKGRVDGWAWNNAWEDGYLETVTGVKYASRSPSRKASRRISTVRSNGLT